MADIRDTLTLDVSQALAAITEIEQALNRALAAVVVDIETGPALAGLDSEFADAADEARQIAFELDDANVSADRLADEMRQVEDATDAAADDMKRVDRETKDASKSASKLGKSLKEGFDFQQLALTAVAAVGAREVIKFLGDSVTAATDLSESINAVQVIFGEASQTILDFGADTSDAVFLAASEFNQLAAVTGTLLQGFGLGVDEVADLTIVLTERAADLASVFNTDVSVALEAINAALRGETEQIRKFTGSFSIDEVKEFGRELFNVTGELTDQQQALAAVEFILSKTAAVQGDAAATADQLANQQRALSEVWGNAQAEIGAAFVPALEEAIPLLIELAGASADVVPALVVVVDTLMEAAKLTGEFAEPVLDLFEGLVTLSSVLNEVEVAGIGVGDMLGFAKDRSIDFVKFGLLGPVTAGNALIDFFTRGSDAGFDLASSLAALDSITPEVAFSFSDYTASVSSAAAASEDAVSASRNLFLSYEDVSAAAESSTVAMDTINDAIAAGVVEWQALQEEAAALPPLVTELGAALGVSTPDVIAIGEAFGDAADDAERFRTLTLELSDPLFAAAKAQERLTDAEATLAELRADETATAQEVANANLDVAEAALEADAASRALGDINLGTGRFAQSVGVVAAALGVTGDEVIGILADAQVLDQTVIGPQVEFLIEDDELNEILNTDYDITVGINYQANNFPAVPQSPGAADSVDPRFGGGTLMSESTTGVVVNINNPTDSDIVGNAAQAGAVLSGYGGAVSRFTGR